MDANLVVVVVVVGFDHNCRPSSLAYYHHYSLKDSCWNRFASVVTCNHRVDDDDDYNDNEFHCCLIKKK